MLKSNKLINIKCNIYTCSAVNFSTNQITQLIRKNFSRRNIQIEKTTESSKKLPSGAEKSSSSQNYSQIENQNTNLNPNKNSSSRLINTEKNSFNSNTNKINKTDNSNKNLEPASDNPTNLYLQFLSSVSKLDTEEQAEFSSRLAQLTQNSHSSPAAIDDSSILNLILSNEIPAKATKSASSEINTMIEEEVSEEEFAAENGIRFRRPPQTLEELKKALAEADEIFEKNKVSFLGQSAKDLDVIESNFMKNLPKHLKVSVLNYPENNSDIVLLGINRYSNLHALWLGDFLGKYEPDGIGVEFPPDDPIFIEGKGNHKDEWANFISKNIDYKFKVDPLPRNVMDVLLTPQKVETLIQNNVDKCLKMKLTPRLIFSDQSNKC